MSLSISASFNAFFKRAISASSGVCFGFPLPGKLPRHGGLLPYLKALCASDKLIQL
jgi:hypothetical protein